jgi:hypothetical protein
MDLFACICSLAQEGGPYYIACVLRMKVPCKIYVAKIDGKARKCSFSLRALEWLGVISRVMTTYLVWGLKYYIFRSWTPTSEHPRVPFPPSSTTCFIIHPICLPLTLRPHLSLPTSIHSPLPAPYSPTSQLLVSPPTPFHPPRPSHP